MKYDQSLPLLSQKSDQQSPLLMRVSFRHVALFTVSLPFLGFIFCIIWSLCFEFERSTYTHCRVANYLPSLSSAIGGYTPQRYVWRICIGLHAAPRFLVACMYGSYYRGLLVEQRCWQRLGKGLAVLHVLENVGLVGLTYISSTENYGVHEKSFIIFVSSALAYMFLSCIIPRMASRKPPSLKDLKIRHLKLFLAVTYCTSGVGAVYFYVRHNSYCEPGIYTMFCLCEYILIVSNMAFHMCAFWDFKDQVLFIGKVPIRKKETSLSEIHLL